jgi:hypothetical protein
MKHSLPTADTITKIIIETIIEVRTSIISLVIERITATFTKRRATYCDGTKQERTPKEDTVSY